MRRLPFRSVQPALATRAGLQMARASIITVSQSPCEQRHCPLLHSRSHFRLTLLFHCCSLHRRGSRRTARADARPQASCAALERTCTVSISEPAARGDCSCGASDLAEQQQQEVRAAFGDDGERRRSRRARAHMQLVCARACDQIVQQRRGGGLCG